MIHRYPLSKSLFDCPSNLKEAIDWILRITGRDGQDGGGGAKALSNQVKNLLNEVNDFGPGLSQQEFEKIKEALSTSGSGNGDLIGKLAEGLQQFIGYHNSNGKIEGTGIAVGRGGRTEEPYKSLTNASGQPGYYLTYNPSDSGCQWNHVSGNATTCARIFLSIIPLIWSALSYLYFHCRQGGIWNKLYLNKGVLGNFMLSMWFGPNRLQKDKEGKHVVTSALSKFEEFAAAKSASTYAEFLQKLQKEGHKKWKEPSPSNATQSHFLSGLYFLSLAYFQHQQSHRPKEAATSPSTIREMLYFLGALPFTSQFGELDAYITNHFKGLVPYPNGQSSDQRPDADLKLPVADSSKVSIQRPNSLSSGDTLSAADLKSHLLTSCLFAPAILGVIQDHSASGESGSDPWLHKLFCNTQLKLSIPSSGSALFNMLSNYSYALQFQLYFLYAQCYSTYSQSCGWRGCRFGKDIQPQSSASSVTSHICQAFKCGGIENCSHGGKLPHTNQCNHHKKAQGCGENGNNSPLQAFLTDTLTPFLAANPGSMSQVPMGFESHLRADDKYQGIHIAFVLGPFCGNSSTPLRQLCEKLGCLTKRTPRTLGDLFGFMWHLNGQLFKNTRPKMADLIKKIFSAFNLGSGPSLQSATERYSAVTKIWNKMTQRKSSQRSATATVLSLSLESMAPSIPFLYQLFMAEESNFLPSALFDLTKHCHRWESGSSGNSTRLVHKDHFNKPCSTVNDLWTLYQPVKPKPMQETDPYKECRNANCGGYLKPLTLTYGATFSPSAAPAYLSWMAYLTDDLYEWLGDMRDEFMNISCKHCSPNCQTGKPCHATSVSDCQCPSVVQCSGVLPLLYRYGFTFTDASLLNGWKYDGHSWQRDGTTKRSCDKFHTQLSNVLSPEAPLDKLITTIDEFLYLFRYYFLSNLSGFWCIYVCIILYTFFILLDTLHVRSHLKLTSSHTVPPIGLLTTGKAPALTKLTYYMP